MTSGQDFQRSDTRLLLVATTSQNLSVRLFIPCSGACIAVPANQVAGVAVSEAALYVVMGTGG